MADGRRLRTAFMTSFWASYLACNRTALNGNTNHFYLGLCARLAECDDKGTLFTVANLNHVLFSGDLSFLDRFSSLWTSVCIILMLFFCTRNYRNASLGLDRLSYFNRVFFRLRNSFGSFSHRLLLEKCLLQVTINQFFSTWLWRWWWRGGGGGLHCFIVIILRSFRERALLVLGSLGSTWRTGFLL